MRSFQGRLIRSRFDEFKTGLGGILGEEKGSHLHWLKVYRRGSFQASNCILKRSRRKLKATYQSIGSGAADVCQVIRMYQLNGRRY